MDGHDQACTSCDISHRSEETLSAESSPGWTNEPQQILPQNRPKQQPPSYFPPGVRQGHGSRLMRRGAESEAGKHRSRTQVCTRSFSFPPITSGVVCYRAGSPAGAYYCPVSHFSGLRKGSEHLSWRPNWKSEMFFTTKTLTSVLTPAMQRSPLSSKTSAFFSTFAKFNRLHFFQFLSVFPVNIISIGFYSSESLGPEVYKKICVF